MWRRSFFCWISFCVGLLPTGMNAGNGAPTERWKRFADAAGIPIPEADLEGIATPLDRLVAATRKVLDRDLGFTEPVICFRLPEGER